MADETKWSLTLEDRTSGPAEQMIARLERLKASVEGDRRAFGELNRSMRGASSGATNASAAFDAQHRRVSELRGQLGGAAGAFHNLGGATSSATKHTKASAKPTLGAAEALERMGIRTGFAESQLGKFVSMVRGGAGASALFTAGAAGLVLALVAVAAATVAATVAVAKYAFAQAGAAREERQRLEVLALLRGRSRTAMADSEALQGAIDRTAASTGAAREELVGYAESAYRAGLRGSALEQALRGAAYRGAALGERWGRAFVFMSAEAGRAGQDLRRLADDAEERYSGLAQRRLRNGGQLWRRFTENIAGLFRGINLEPLLKSLSKFVSLFSTSNEVGRTLKGTFENFFNGVVEGLSKLVDRTTEYVELGTLGALRLRNAWLFFQIGVLRSLNDMSDALDNFFGRVADFDAGLPDWVRSGLDMAVGLQTGIDAGAVRARAAAARMADGVAETFRKRAKIASPSKLFAGFGDNLAEGVAVGVERTTPEARTAIGELVSAPSLADMQRAGADSPASSSARPTVTIGDVTISIQADGKTAEDVFDELRSRIAELFETAALQMGAPA